LFVVAFAPLVLVMSAAGGLAKQRLMQERRQWRKDHPHAFFARPRQNPDSTTNMMVWDCGIPGKPNTPWAGGLYPITIEVRSRVEWR
jgi:ubiquitin-conjugating enzyme E2 I